MMVDCLPLQMA